MALLYYGGGDCAIRKGNVSSLTIYYRGKIIVDSKLPIDYKIELEVGKLIIKPATKSQNLNELFSYIGEFRIKAISAKNMDGEKEHVGIRRVMDYSELLETNAEDLTILSENINASHLHGRKVRRARVLLQTSNEDNL